MITGVIAILAFFGVRDFGELKQAIQEGTSGDSLADPCKAVSVDYVTSLGMRAEPVYAGAEFSKDSTKNGARWKCFWRSEDDRTRLSIGYSQEQSHVSGVQMGPMDGIPDGMIGRQYDTIATSCFADWPTSFGQGEVWFSGTCPETKQVAVKAYENLSR
ncbi:hypothetical protein Strvi_9467 (plasmid) [Streptomyces violaceusniger Tu 4113]|uniref:DUF3558 domain-containing protein n=1 Tax=Streptomyces violaceusniger (strain Tu 4113) TaxID=653045 RepID=G2PH73_STRV4|nr:hypothetical protein Strvi_9467 [Streptomyces violaceusniger Tu 4113]